MANPNRTAHAMRNRKMAMVAEQIFDTRTDAQTWLDTQTGDRKRVTQFRFGKFGTRQYKYAARVYRYPVAE